MNYLFGDSGHGRVVYDIICAMGLRVDAFVDRSPKQDLCKGIPCFLESAVSFTAADQLLFSIGDNAIRKRLAAKYAIPYLTAIHPSVVMGSEVTIGSGTAVMAGAVLNANAVIGSHAIINTGAVVEHDCLVGDFAHVSPHATLCGNVQVGAGTHVGAGAVVIPGIRIGKGCIIGAGAVVINPVPDYSVVVGCPGRTIRTIVSDF